MKKVKLIGGVIIGTVAVFSLLFMALTGPVTYDQTAGEIYNKDINNQKRRPFVVDKEEYPFKSNWFKKDGVSMHYLDEGEGISIVLMHGNPDWSFLNRNIIKQLSGEARLIAPDLPGFGFSDTPPDFSFTPQEHVEWIRSLVIDHLKLEKFIIVVQDWGGPIGLSFATSHPDRVTGVVIGNTWAWEADGIMKTFSNVANTAAVQRLITNRNFFATTLMQDTLGEDKKNNPAITDAYAMAFPTPESRRGTAEFPRQINAQASWLAELEGRLHTLADKPVEFIFGLKDFLLATPEVRARWKSHFPEAPVLLLEDANHFSQEDSPESYALSLRRIMAQVSTTKKVEGSAE